MAPEHPNPNRLSWEEYRFHLTSELERMSEILEEMSEKLTNIEQRQALSERDAKWAGSLFGFAAAALVEVGRVLVSFLHK